MESQFKRVFPALHTYLDGNNTNAGFVSYFVTLITEEPIESGKKTRQHTKAADRDITADIKPATLAQWYKRGFPRQKAGAILNRFDPDLLFNVLDGLADETAEKLVGDLRPVIPTITAKNYANEIIEWLTNYLHAAARRKRLTSQEQAAHVDRSDELKRKFGSHLLNEAKLTCMSPGCGAGLTMLDRNGRAQELYEVVPIDPAKSPEFHNVAAMCPRCAKNHLEAATRSSIKSASAARQQLHQRAQLEEAISSGDIGPQLLNVLRRLGAYRRSEGIPAISYDVATISQKVDEDNEPFLFDTIRQSVTMYYPVVHSILQDLESSGEIDTELIRVSMKGDYLRLRSQSREKVFETIAGKINKATQAPMQLCYVIGSYFVQSCDIFSKAPELGGGTNALAK